MGAYRIRSVRIPAADRASGYRSLPASSKTWFDILGSGRCRALNKPAIAKVTPAMEAGITDRLWSLEDIVARIDAMAPTTKPRGPYKKRAA
jgi:hypothetical protein